MDRRYKEKYIVRLKKSCIGCNVTTAGERSEGGFISVEACIYTFSRACDTREDDFVRVDLFVRAESPPSINQIKFSSCF